MTGSDTVTGDRKLLLSSLLLNWVLGPAVMFALAWLLLPDLPEYRTGLIIVGLARCIAMVIIWNDLALWGPRSRGGPGRPQLAVSGRHVRRPRLVLPVCPARLARPANRPPSAPRRGRSPSRCSIFLGIPLLAGYLSRRFGEKAKGRSWYEVDVPAQGSARGRCTACCSPSSFCSPCKVIRSPAAPSTLPASLCRCSPTSPSCGWAATYLGAALGLGYQRTTTLAFTAAGNNFELAIAVAIATYGATSGQALAGVVGPLIEVPVLVALVYVSLAMRRRFTDASTLNGRSTQ